MKRMLLVMAICSVTMVACKKERHPKSEYPYVYLNHCINGVAGDDETKLCFNEVVSDNRCPENRMCVLEGTAVARFTFSINHNSHHLTLSTLPLNVPFAKDTIIENYKVELLNIKPVPSTGLGKPKGKIFAEVRILKL